MTRALIAALVLAAGGARAQPPGDADGDPAGAPQPIGFRDAVAQAVARNPDARGAADEIARTAALLEQAQAALAPQIAASGTFTRLEGDRYVAMRRAQAADSGIAAVSLTMPIVDLRARADRDRAADQVDVAATAAASVRRDVAIAAARAYFAVLTAGHLADAARLARDTSAQHVAFASERRKAGIGTELDLVRAQTELAGDESQLASAETALLRAEEALGVITGSDHPLDTDGEPPLDADLDRARATQQRADLIASRRRTDAALSSWRESWTDWAPTLTLAGQGFLTAPQIDPIPRAGYQIDVTLTIALFDGGRRRGLAHERRAVYAEAYEQLGGVERQARSEVRVADAALADVRRERDAAHDAQRFAAHALELADQAFKGGAATSLDVIDAQRTARDAAVRAAIADDDVREAELDRLAATGDFP